MKSLERAIAGEHVVIERPQGRGGSKLVWRTIFKVTEKLIYTSSSSTGNRYRKADGRSMEKYDNGVMRYPTDEEIDARLRELKAQAKADEERAAYDAREDVKLAKRFASTEVEEWLNIPLEKLELIAFMLENWRVV